MILRLLIIFLAGGLIGASFDQLHVRFGVLSYTNGDLLGQPWWVAPQFGFATLAFFLVGLRLVKESPGDPTPRDIAFSAIHIVLAWIVTLLFVEETLLVTVALSLQFAVRFAIYPEKKSLLIAAFLSALGGTIYESTLTSTGTYGFSHPDFLRVPMWLPALYANLAPFTLLLAKKLAPAR